MAKEGRYQEAGMDRACWDDNTDAWTPPHTRYNLETPLAGSVAWLWCGPGAASWWSGRRAAGRTDRRATDTEEARNAQLVGENTALG
ncbi:hypothetical protein E2C01_058398 [Portunus trituberculatus]|uniref:Uncharacterized protein n=1 Tax=Portunus trituberculatus TaxID=210409 RepID=A0A5B7H4L4_PORTR|nr:hypothetical protein [Portunus trituberculatus]